MSATSASALLLHRPGQGKCSSCGKWKVFAAFNGRLIHPNLPTTHSPPLLGRATCGACRTRKRLKGASLNAQRLQTLGSLQLENQQLSCQLTQTAKELTESNQEIAALIELLGKHAADALDTHTRLRKQRKQAAPAAVTPNPIQEISAETNNKMAPPAVICNSEEIESSAKHRAPHTSPMALFNHSPVPFTFEPELNKIGVIPQPVFVSPDKRKAPCDSQGAQASQLSDVCFGTQFVYEIDEWFQFPLDDHSHSSMLLPSSCVFILTLYRSLIIIGRGINTMNI